MIFVIDDDKITGEAIIRVIKKNGHEAKLFADAYAAIDAIEGSALEMVFLDVFLTGPDGFTFLNELASYEDTMNVPAVLVSERDFSKYDLSEYNVVGCLNKSTMKPSDVKYYLDKCLGE